VSHPKRVAVSLHLGERKFVPKLLKSQRTQGSNNQGGVNRKQNAVEGLNPMDAMRGSSSARAFFCDLQIKKKDSAQIYTH